MAAEKITTSVTALSLLAISIAVPEKFLSPLSPPTVDCCPRKEVETKVSWPRSTKIPSVVKWIKKQFVMRVRAESITRRPPPW